MLYNLLLFSCSVMSNSWLPHGLQHAWLHCPSPTPGVTQTHVHWVSDAIQPSYPLSSPSPPTINLSQHQGLFKWVSSLYQVAKVLKLQLQHQSFQWIFRVGFLQDWLVRAPCCPRDSSARVLCLSVFFSTTIWKHQFTFIFFFKKF